MTMSKPDPALPALDALRTTRSMRRLKSDPIPDDILKQIHDAASRAPSGSNQQTWSFIVVTDPDLKREIQKIYNDVAKRYFESGPRTNGDG
jgi:nitroreductase